MKFLIDVVQILAFFYFVTSTLENYSYNHNLSRNLFVYAKYQMGCNPIINCEPGTYV